MHHFCEILEFRDVSISRNRVLGDIFSDVCNKKKVRMTEVMLLNKNRILHKTFLFHQESVPI